MSRFRQVAAAFLLVGFGIVLAFLVLEGGVRLLHLVPTRFWEADPLLGARLVPGRTGWWTQEDHEFTVPVRINSQGRRDVEESIEKPPGVFRVLLLGDSFVEALHVPLEKSIGRQLEEQIARRVPGRRVQVVSMGVSGYGTASELLYYRTKGRAYDPDLVVLAFYPGNDIVNNSPTLEANLKPVYGGDGTLLRVVSGKAGGKGGKRRRRGLLARSQAYQYVRKLLLTKHPALAARLASLGLLKRGAVRREPTVDGVPVDYWVYAAHPPAAWKTAWRHTEDLLRALHAAVQADGAGFAVTIVTARDVLYPDDWRQVVAASPAMASVEWDLGGPERRLMAWCDAERVPCLQLSTIFAPRAKTGPRLHFHYDGHWTAAGHALAAEALADFLQQKKLLPEGGQEGS